MPKCLGIKRDGSQCTQTVEPLQAYCWWHHPNNAHKRQLEEKLRLAGLWQDTGLVFTTSTGTPLDGDSLTKRSFGPLLKRAGLPKIRFHDLRHTFATVLLSRGTHPKVVQEMLGHASVSQTMDTYSHVLPDMQDVAVSAMESGLS